MKEKRKSTPKAKALTAVLLVLFLGSCAVLIYAVFTDILGLDNPPSPTEPSATIVATEPVTTEVTINTTEAPATSAVNTTTADIANSDDIIILGATYNADYWIEHKAEHDTSGLALLFGSKIQSVFISFDNGRFSVNGVSYNEPQAFETGTYSFMEDGNIELRFDNSDIATATVLNLENGVITSMDFPLTLKDTTLRLSLAAD